MNTEQIKADIQAYRAKGAKVDPVDYVIKHYVTPLESSHRELVSKVNDVLLLLPFVINATESGTNRNHLTDINIILQTALSNAKNLINEQR